MKKVRREGEEESNRKVWVLIVLAVVLFCLTFLAASGKLSAPVLGRTVSLVLAPFQSVVSFVGQRVYAVGQGVWNVYAVYDQNRMLRNEVEELRVQNLAANEAIAENSRLRALLQYRDASKQFDLVAARVIGREAATWTSMLIIDRGTVMGVHENMPVVTEKGLVGIVVEANLYSSKVRLILDPRDAVGVLVQRPTSRVAGIVEGDPANPGALRMVNVPKGADIVEGDTIVTSGFGGLYPKGLLIGTVEQVQNDEAGLLKYAYIDPAVDFQKLEDVAVIVASREAPPEPLTPPKQTPGTETDPLPESERRKAEVAQEEQAAQTRAIQQAQAQVQAAQQRLQQLQQQQAQAQNINSKPNDAQPNAGEQP